MRCERGQASVEWVGLVLLASLALGALAAAVPAIDGRSFGGFLSHHILCATRARDCGDRDAALTAAYGADDAALVRRHAPGIVYEPGERSLPVDWRACRARTCSEAADDRDLDTHRTGTGLPATAFTRLVRREGRVYLQYWLYYPDSNTAALGSDKVWNASPLRALGRYPGFHPDDWEAYAVRIDRDGEVSVRASSHGHWQWCKHAECRSRWGRSTGWTRVSHGSHAGHVPLSRRISPRRGRPGGFGGQVDVDHSDLLPGGGLRERTTTAEGLRLVPLEPVARGRYRPLDPDIRPPWLKPAYSDPENGES